MSVRIISKSMKVSKVCTDVCKIIMLAWVGLFLTQTHAKDRIVYGVDNRRDIHDVTNPLHKEWGRSTAAMMSKHSLKELGDGSALVEIVAEKNPMGLCEDESFSQQFMAANCTGFLVAPDILVTAGHCLDDRSQCDEFDWVFDFHADTMIKNDLPVISKQQIYHCSEIISQELDHDTKMDYAIVRLDRPVLGRKPFSMRTTGSVTVGEEMVVVGYPSGLPLKVADGAIVRNTDHPSYFVFNGDTFQGNSGSPVIHAKTGEIEGILVRGDRDYLFDSTKGCFRVNKCEENECRGEDVTRITEVIKKYQQVLNHLPGHVGAHETNPVTPVVPVVSSVTPAAPSIPLSFCRGPKCRY